jgi:cell division septation protein DedD
MNAFSRLRAAPVGWALSLLASAPLWVSPAAAEPTAADRESARALMKEGDAAVASQDWTTARRAYAEAHRLMKLPSTGRELARAEEALGHFLEAKDVCETVARTPKTPGEPAPFEVARTECVAVVAALDKRIATVRIAVQGPGADSVKISLDGATFPGPNALRRANPGEHELSAVASAGGTARQVVQLLDGETKDVTLTLVPPAAPVAVPPPAGTTTAAPTAPTAAPPPTPPTSTASPSGGNTTAYVLLGVGGAALVTGGVFGALALSDYGKADDACPTHKGCSASAIDSRDAAGTKAWVANGGIGLGVLLGAVGTYLLVSGPSAPATSAARSKEPSRFLNPSVMFTRSGAGASVGGTF